MTRLIVFASATAVALSACGGGGASRPKPLSHHFDEVNLVRVDMEKKQEMFAAQNEYQIARDGHAKAKADLADAKSNLQIAKNELEQAKIGERSASEKKKTADATSDMNRINPAMKTARVAELTRRAADQKVAARKAKISHLEKLEIYWQEEEYHKEARFEQVKAKLARDSNIKPKGFEFGVYAEQVQERSKRSQRAKAVADKEEKKAAEKNKSWRKAVEQMEAAKGGGASAGSK